MVEYIGKIKRICTDDEAWLTVQTDDGKHELRISLPVGYASTLKVGESFRMQTSGDA